MKKFIIRLLLGIGVAIVLILAFSGILVFKRNLNVPKVQASPGPACTVNDDLRVSGKVGTNGFDPATGYPAGWGGGIHTWDVYAEGTVGVGSGGNLKAYFNNAGDLYFGNYLISRKYAPGTGEADNDGVIVRFYNNADCNEAAEEGKIVYKNDRRVGELCVCTVKHKGLADQSYGWFCFSSAADWW
jgi:hypothetical protein